MKIHLSMWIQWLFLQKNLNQRSLTPRWPLTPHLLRSHVWLYPRIIVSKSYENTSKYVDTVTFFAKTWTKGHWPLDDLWPHICWGHVCDSTQGSLCPKSHGNTSMYVDTVINFANYHIYTTYYVQNQWSHSLSQARQKKTKQNWLLNNKIIANIKKDSMRSTKMTHHMFIFRSF